MRRRALLPASLLLASVAVAWSAARSHAQEPVGVTSKRARLMTGAVSSSQGGLLSGLFLTEPGSGWILYRQSVADEPRRIGFHEFERKYQFRRPAGLVFADPKLYVYDQATRTVSSLLMRGDQTKPELELISQLDEHPSHLAVSPHGLVAVIQDKDIFFLEKDRPPIRYTRSRFPDPIDLAFSSWNTLQVLDSERGTLVSITFRRLSNGEIVFEDEANLPAPEEGPHRWRGMSIYEGVVYLVDEQAVYAYLAADKRLVPVATRGELSDPIQGLALTYQRLYALHGDHVTSSPRAEPIDLALEGGPVDSQRALLALYRYLDRSGLLLTRTVRARAAETRLDDFLFENGVLLAPRREPSDKAARTLAKGRTPDSGSAEEKDFLQLLCSLNARSCREAGPSWSMKMVVPQRSALEVPRVQLLSRISRASVELDGLTLREHVAWRVPSRELRTQAETLLPKLNSGWTSDELLQRTKGLASVPVEHWTVLVAVPASDFRDRSSRLWSLMRAYPGARLYGREGFTTQSAKSLALAQPPLTPSAECTALQRDYRRLVEAIRYPVEYRRQPPGNEETPTLLHPRLLQDDPAIGILEYATTVRTGHQAFCRDSSAPSWHQAVNLELLAQPDPATYSTASRDLVGAATFSEEAHHGTHVAALIGGRQMDCWSGLLPKARLVLVDLTDGGRLARSIANAVDAQVRVFNVSQGFDGDRQELHDTIRHYEQSALFVAAAGPGKGGSGRLLNGIDGASVPAPARWGQWSNVVTVTGMNASGQLLPQLNRGKRYVDLAALGENVLSASEAPGSYGPATGSSQAAPQVAAAAALLVDLEGEAKLTPGDAKARLIATADWDWSGAYDDALWGGRLDFAAAVRFPTRNVLVTTVGAALRQLHAITPKKANELNVRLVNAPTYYERQGTGDVPPDKIKFNRILSLRKQPDGRFRVVLSERNQLKIILNAELAGERKLECLSAERLRPDGTFEADSRVCAGGISIDQIEQYFRGGAYHVQWQ